MFYVTSTYLYKINPYDKPIRFIIQCENMDQVILTQHYFIMNPDYSKVNILEVKPYYSKSRYQTVYRTYNEMERVISNYIDLIYK